MNLDPLWAPLTINSVELKNRVVLTAHALVSSKDNILGQASIDYYEERARGGVGLIITEAQMVHPSGKGMVPTAQEGYLPESVAAFRKLAETVHPYGAKVFCEMGHMGPPDDNMMFLDNYRAILSPSGVPAFNTNEMPKPMEADDFAALIDGFVTTARNAKSGGLDGVEIHAAHGFLLSSFLSPGTNHRTDQYGGSTENRCRFLLDIARAVRAEIGADFPMGVRLSFEEFTPDGIHSDEAERIIEHLHGEGLFDYYSISGGHLVSVHTQISPMGVEPNLLQPFAARTKKIVGDTPVITVNRITNVEQAASIIESQTADLVAMVRAHLADPYLVSKAQRGQLDLIRECVSCNQGCLGRLFKLRAISCTINPTSGREGTWGGGSLPEIAQRRDILVVGAGPAGLKVAETAAARGHSVTVVERHGEIGGAVRYASQLPLRSRWNLLTESFARSLDSLGVDVQLGVEASPQLVADRAPDVVVVATGATYDKSGYSSGLAFRTTIPGIDTVDVLDPTDVINDPESCGPNVVIVDDSLEYTGLGLAELLVDTGRTVEVVSRHLSVGADTATTGDIGHLYPRLRSKGVTITAQHFVSHIRDGKAEISEVWGGDLKHEVPVSTVVVNMQRFPVTDLYDQLRGVYAGELHRIGDCLAPRHIDEAIYEGEKLGRSL